MKKGLIFLALLALSLPVVGAIYQWWSSRREAREYPAPGRRIDVGGYKLHLYATGKSQPGVPSVVLDAGSGGTCLSWCKVQAEISEFTRVCSFDRAGMGWSDMGSEPRSCLRIAKELHTLLHKGQISAPYLLVGHSFGGMNMRVFAATYPEEVAGLVLVDAPNEAEIERLPDTLYSTVRKHVRRAVWYVAAMSGMLRLALRMKIIAHDMQEYPEELQPIVKWLYAQPKAVKARDDEELVIQKSCAQVRATRPYLHDMPLVVLSAGNKGFFTPLMDYQRELASLSTQSRHIIASESGHLVQFDQPELVIDVIREQLYGIDMTSLQEHSPVLPVVDKQELDIQYT